MRGLGLEAVAIARGNVELRGWVSSRATRALAARVVRAVPGIDTVTNNILVRGEDDLTPHDEPA
ncbi:MAG: BON domain-containing protein [Gemmatimonadales bacterium]|nr:BON domain-containing protein [Gemmatimonadales bacterium]